MILSWGKSKGKQPRAFFINGSSRGFRAERLDKIGRQLDMSDAAVAVTDMDKPGWDLHPLKGDRDGVWAVKVTGPWRITFRVEGGHAHIVDYEQYH